MKLRVKISYVVKDPAAPETGWLGYQQPETEEASHNEVKLDFKVSQEDLVPFIDDFIVTVEQLNPWKPFKLLRNEMKGSLAIAVIGVEKRDDFARGKLHALVDRISLAPVLFA